MTSGPIKPNRLAELISQLLDGQLSEADLEELRAVLRVDDSAREIYLEQIVTHAMLQWRTGTVSIPAKQDADTESTTPSAAHAGGAESTPAGVTQSNPMGVGQSVLSGPLKILGIPFSSFAVFCAFVLLALPLLIFGYIHVLEPWQSAGPKKQDLASSAKPASTPKAAQLRVARLTKTINSRWDEATKGLQVGDIMPASQPHDLLSGIAELTFDNGARLLLQSPVSFSLDSRNTVQLLAGKLTAEIKSQEARGFKVITPAGTFTDQGTQFGVEIDPHNFVRMCVLKGEVSFVSNTENADHGQSWRLLAGSGVRVEDRCISVVDDSGDSFIRSVEAAEKGRHTLAFWRFEDVPTKILSGDNADKPLRLFTVDSSYNGNDLFTDNLSTQIHLSNDVATPLIPLTAMRNSNCFDNIARQPGLATMPGLFTHSSSCHAAPIDIQEVLLPQWTIEASVKPNKLDGIQTFVGRSGAVMNIDAPVRFAFQITQEGCFAVSFRDAEDRPHGVVANNYIVTTGKWYHVAAVSDGRHLTLYVNALDGRGYRELAATTLPDHGSTALASGGADAPWTIGFGKDPRSARAAKQFYGCLDEIRICDQALVPSEFLFAQSDDQPEL
jgi:hypothetical protein